MVRMDAKNCGSAEQQGTGPSPPGQMPNVAPTAAEYDYPVRSRSPESEVHFITSVILSDRRETEGVEGSAFRDAGAPRMALQLWRVHSIHPTNSESPNLSPHLLLQLSQIVAPSTQQGPPSFGRALSTGENRGLCHNFNAHGAGRSLDALDRRFHGSRVQIGHLLGGDVAHLLFRNLADLFLVGGAGALGNAGRLHRSE